MNTEILSKWTVKDEGKEHSDCFAILRDGQYITEVAYGKNQAEFDRGWLTREAAKEIAERIVLQLNTFDALLTNAKGAAGYLNALPASHKPDSAWFKPLYEAIWAAEGRSK